MKLFLRTLAIAAMIVLIGSCKLEIGTDTDPNDNASGVDYTSHNENAAIYVRNYTGRKLVAFKGSLSAGTLIGGIPAHEEDHALENNPALFDRNQAFPMILITEEQYLANKDKLRELESTPFTRIFVFFNRNGENETRYEISNRLGGIYKLTVQNPSTLDVELRLGGVGGETIGFATGKMLTTVLYVNEGDFNIFPVFRRYNPLRDSLETLIPQGRGGYPWFQPLGFADEDGQRDQTFNVKDAISTLESRTSGVAWLVLNNSTGGSVHLMKGNEVVKTSATGTTYFNGTKQFQVDMPAVGVGNSQSYATSIKIANYKVGPDGFEVPINTEANAGLEGEELELLADMMYTVTIKGSHNDGDLEAIINLDAPTPVDLTDFMAE